MGVEEVVVHVHMPVARRQGEGSEAVLVDDFEAGLALLDGHEPVDDVLALVQDCHVHRCVAEGVLCVDDGRACVKLRVVVDRFADVHFTNAGRERQRKLSVRTL
jgi:hypothetical protein